MVVFEATCSFGSACVEALLALGAHVVAAAPLRTQLETLSARMRHHERLHTAECVTESAAGTLDLLRSVARRGAIDSVLLTAEQGPGAERALGAIQAAVSAVVAELDPAQAAPRLVWAWPARAADALAQNTQGAQDAADATRESAPTRLAASSFDVLRYDPACPVDGVKALLWTLSEDNKE